MIMQYVQNLTTNSIEVVNLGSAYLHPGFAGWMDGATNTFLLNGTNVIAGQAGAFMRVVISPGGVHVSSLDWMYIVPLSIFFGWFFYKIMWRLLGYISGGFRPSISD